MSTFEDTAAPEASANLAIEYAARMARMAGPGVLLALVTLGVFACDRSPAKLEEMERSAKETPPSPPAEPAPLPPRKPELVIDASGATVAGLRVDFAAPDPKGRILVALSGNPVENETVAIIAARDAKTPDVAVAFSAVAEAKAKDVLLRTQRRDRTTAEIPFVLSFEPPGCTAVGHIGKDVAITTWPVSGGTATRFAKGMAGPDLTLGSEGIRKKMAACEAPAWLVSADETVNWGLVVDLVLAVNFPDEGVPPPRAKQVALLTRAPVPGRKVSLER
jgi:hypothetical protein